uniref:Virion structural protein n=1 Tax=Pseudomonas phage RVTF4 TaxID=3236931 RepID=A0AB39CDB8_9VIRU
MSIYTRYGTNEVVSVESVADKPVDPIRQFYRACETISMEAAEVGSIAGFFVRAGNNLSMAIKRGFEFMTTYDWAPLPTLYPGNMRSIARTRDFMQWQDKYVAQPRGFIGNLHDYVLSMEPRILLAAQIVNNVLAPAIHRLGYYVTNPSQRGDRRDFPGGSADVAQTAKLLADESKWFGKGDNNATAAFGQLFNSMNEFVVTDYKLVEYAQLLDKAKPADVRKQVETLSTMAQGLFKSLGSESDPASKQLIQTIGNELANAAKWVEWYAVQYTKLLECTQVVAQLEKELR